MKKLMPLLLLFLLITGKASYGQKVTVESERWISASLDHLYFNSSGVYFNFNGHDMFKHKYSIDNDTIKMIDTYTSSADNFKQQHTTVFKFIIRYFDGKKLTIQAIGDDAVKLAGPNIIVFKDLKDSFDNSIKFSKIHFMSSTCYNGCPQLAIDILPDGTYTLIAGDNAAPYRGNYYGRLTTAQLDSLNYLLKRSELKKMYDWEQTGEVADAPNYYFDIDFVNSKKRLNINTNSPPLNITGLVNFMLSSYKTVQLTKLK